MIPDLSAATWRKSSRSGGNGGQCVELAIGKYVIGVRDSKNPDYTLTFGTGVVDQFLGAVKRKQFDS